MFKIISSASSLLWRGWWSFVIICIITMKVLSNPTVHWTVIKTTIPSSDDNVYKHRLICQSLKVFCYTSKLSISALHLKTKITVWSPVSCNSLSLDFLPRLKASVYNVLCLFQSHSWAAMYACALKWKRTYGDCFNITNNRKFKKKRAFIIV